MFNYVFFATEYDWYKFMYQEILPLKNVKYYTSIWELLNPFEKFIFSHGNRFIRKAIYHQSIQRIEFPNDNEICFIHFSRFLPQVRDGITDVEKKIHPSCKAIHYFTDVKHITNENLQLLNNKMDSIGVYDPNIALKYDLNFWPNSFPSLTCTNENIEYDLCFVGSNRGRENRIKEIALFYIEHGVKIAFYLLNASERTEIEGVHYLDKSVPYIEVIELVKKSRCVLELEGYDTEHACSMRVLEAVVLNKKILTSNKRVLDMPVCCECRDNIQHFDNIQDIDAIFLLEGTGKYRYHEEFSAKKFLDRIENEIR